MNVEDLLAFDEKKAIESITTCLEDVMMKSGTRGYVVGISGGIDSAVTASLLVKAVGRDKVVGLIMPEKETSEADIDDAKTVAEHLGIRYEFIDITPVVENLLRLFGDDYETAPRVPKGNVKARVRMVTLYYYANKNNFLVAATGDKSEFLLGYFTKWGDGAGDVYPIINLYKTQVRRLGAYLGLPRKIVEKPSSPGLWPGQTAEGELGLSYEVVDRVLALIVDRGARPEEAASMLGVSMDIVNSILEKIRRGEHKRSPFKFCKI